MLCMETHLYPLQSYTEMALWGRGTCTIFDAFTLLCVLKGPNSLNDYWAERAGSNICKSERPAHLLQTVSLCHSSVTRLTLEHTLARLWCKHQMPFLPWAPAAGISTRSCLLVVGSQRALGMHQLCCCASCKIRCSGFLCSNNDRTVITDKKLEDAVNPDVLENIQEILARNLYRIRRTV